MIGEQRLANAVDGLMPGEDIAAVFAAARKARNSWVAVAVAVWFFFVFFGPSGSSALSGALLSTAAGAVAMGFVVLVRPSPRCRGRHRRVARGHRDGQAPQSSRGSGSLTIPAKHVPNHRDTEQDSGTPGPGVRRSSLCGRWSVSRRGPTNRRTATAVV